MTKEQVLARVLAEDSPTVEKILWALAEHRYLIVRIEQVPLLTTDGDVADDFAVEEDDLLRHIVRQTQIHSSKQKKQ